MMREPVVHKYPVRRPVYRQNPYMLPSGAIVVPIGRRRGSCESGLHKHPVTKVIMGIPYLSCSACGFLFPRPVLDQTMTRREMIDRIQREMEKDKPLLYSDTPLTEAEMQKRREALMLKAWDNAQKYKRTKTGKFVRQEDRK